MSVFKLIVQKWDNFNKVKHVMHQINTCKYVWKCFMMRRQTWHANVHTQLQIANLAFEKWGWHGAFLLSI